MGSKDDLLKAYFHEQQQAIVPGEGAAICFITLVSSCVALVGIIDSCGISGSNNPRRPPSHLNNSRGFFYSTK